MKMKVNLLFCNLKIGKGRVEPQLEDLYRTFKMISENQANENGRNAIHHQCKLFSFVLLFSTQGK